MGSKTVRWAPREPGQVKAGRYRTDKWSHEGDEKPGRFAALDRVKTAHGSTGDVSRVKGKRRVGAVMSG